MAPHLRQNRLLQPLLVDPLIFDREHFERQTFGDVGLQREIIQLFLAQAEDARKTLAFAMSDTSWRFLTHTLRGAASAVGALRIAELASVWELGDKPGDDAARSALVQVFKDELAAFSLLVADYRD